MNIFFEPFIIIFKNHVSKIKFPNLILGPCRRYFNFFTGVTGEEIGFKPFQFFNYTGRFFKVAHHKDTHNSKSYESIRNRFEAFFLSTLKL